MLRVPVRRRVRLGLRPRPAVPLSSPFQGKGPEWLWTVCLVRACQGDIDGGASEELAARHGNQSI